MPYYGGRWHLFSEAERRAYGELMRKKESEAWHAKWISKAGLKKRLWTDKAISQFLGKPRSAGPILAWTRKAVLKAESTPEFRAWLHKRMEWLLARGKLPQEYMPDNVIPIDFAHRSR